MVYAMALGNGGLGSGGVLDTIMHPELLDSLNRFYPATVTIQVSTQTRRANGEIVNEWTAVSAALTNITGILASAAAAERRGAVLTVQTATHVLDLQGYYPDIVVTHRAVVVTAVSSGLTRTLNIVAVHHDSQSQQTKLELEEVNH
jgi:head-tail adaptor